MSDGKTSYKIINWLDLVKEAWGPEFYEPDVSYRWGNGREFKDTQESHGLYADTASSGDEFLLEAGDFISLEDDGELIQE